MKQFLFALAGIFLIISCNDGNKVAGVSEDNHAARNSENMREIYRALETGDVSKLDSFLTEDFIDYNGNYDGSDVHGRDSVKALISRIHTYFDGFKITPVSDATSADGNYHFAMMRMQGKAKENPWGMKPGTDIDDTSVDVIKIRDGKAAEHWGFMSHGDINEMMKGMPDGMPPASDTTKNKH